MTTPAEQIAHALEQIEACVVHYSDGAYNLDLGAVHRELVAFRAAVVLKVQFCGAPTEPLARNGRVFACALAPGHKGDHA